MWERKLTFRALAEETRRVDPAGRGYRDSYLNQIATGISHPSVEAMEIIAKALGSDPAVFAEYRLAAVRRRFDEQAVSFPVVAENLAALSAWLKANSDLEIADQLLPILRTGEALDATRSKTPEELRREAEDKATVEELERVRRAQEGRKTADTEEGVGKGHRE